MSRERMRSPATGPCAGSGVTAGVTTMVETPGGAAIRPAILPLQLGHQIVHDPLERIEAEGRGHRRAQVGVGVDVVEHAPASGSFQIFDPADREAGRLHDPRRGVNGSGWNFWKRCELYWRSRHRWFVRQGTR